VESIDEQPVLSPGQLGMFDDSGVTNSCVVHDGDCTLLFYTGWSRGVTVPFYFYVGLAASEDGGQTFERTSRAPLLERSSVDPLLTASPYVMQDGDRWRIWYVSCDRWQKDPDGTLRHFYHVRYAESAQPRRFHPQGVVALDFAGDEHAISRPCITRTDAGLQMWFAARGDAYRLGSATSADGIVFNRDAEEPLLTGEAGSWERDMAAYPWVFERCGHRYMLYNGNGYGASGIGCAVEDPGPALHRDQR
jgi:hypothetical protein